MWDRQITQHIGKHAGSHYMKSSRYLRMDSIVLVQRSSYNRSQHGMAGPSKTKSGKDACYVFAS